MGGGGGDTTEVTNTGLGDDQYQALADNQVGISGQISDARTDATARYDAFDGRFGNLDTSISGLSTSMLDQFKNSTDNVNTQFTNMGGRFDSLDTSVGANNQGIGNLQSSVEGVGSDVTAGFADTQPRFDTVDTANQNIQDDVTTGFTDQAQAFSDVQGAMTDNTGNIRDDITSNFQTTNDALASSEQNIRDDVETSQANVLGGQGGLAADLSDLSNTNDIYFDTLATNQDNLQTGQEGFQTSFDTYVDRYSDDTTLANQTRADLQQAQATGFDTVRSNIGTLGNSVAEGQQALSQQSNDNTQLMADTVEGGFQQSAQTSQNLRDVLSTQIDDSTSGIMSNQDTMVNAQGELAQGQQDMANTVVEGQSNLANTFMNESGEIDASLVNQTRDLAAIAATQTDLDMNHRQNFKQLSTAFDDQGQLIQNSVDESGNTIMREMDQNGNLMLRALDATGRDMGSKIINVNESVSDLQNLQRVQGANMSMGNLSPASQGAVPTSGFASPFTTTQ